MCIVGISEEERRNGAGEIFEVIMVKSFPKLMTYNKQEIQEIQRTSNNKYQKSIPRHIIIRMQKTKDKDKILKETERQT